MNIFNLFRKSAGAPVSVTELDLLNFFGASVGQATATKAMRQATVWACVNVLASSQSILPIKLMQKNRDGSRVQITDHPVASILAKPNDWQTPSDFARAIGTQLAMYGNFHAYIAGTVGRPLELLSLEPRSLRAERAKITDPIVYKGNGKEYTRDEILHFFGLSFDGINGVSPIEYNRGTISSAIIGGEHSDRTLKSGGRLAGVINFTSKVTEEQIKKFNERWNAGDKAERVHFLGGGDKFQPVSSNNKDIQYIELSQLKLTEICAIFGVPPHMVADVTKSANSNLAAQNIQFIKHTMLPICRSVEQRYELSLLADKDRARGLYIRHNLAALERADLLTRSQAAIHWRTAGVETQNELRAIEDLPPVEGGDTLNVPLNSSTSGEEMNEEKGA